MVKNMGGNKSKKQARKKVNVPQQRNLRYRSDKEEDEMYAIVTKLYGGSNSSVFCMDGMTRHCIIRNKFRGRDKRDNIITTNTWVLVGLRNWEARGDKQQRCDLLEVYSDNEKEKLISNVKQDVVSLLKIDDEQNEYLKQNIDFVDDDIETIGEMNNSEDDNGECLEEKTINIDEI